MSIFINKNKKYKYTSNKAENIFEDSFDSTQEEIDDVEDFIKENGEDLM